MKTLKQFEKQETLGYDEWLKPLDEIDELLYFHIGCGYVASNFDDGKFIQNGECNEEKNGVRYYDTCSTLNGKYYYLGSMPSFEPDVY